MPEAVVRACDVDGDIGFSKATSTKSLYAEAGLLTVTSRSKDKPPSVPRFFQRMLPEGRAAPVVSLARVGISCPVCTASKASVHSMDEKSMLTLERSHALALSLPSDLRHRWACALLLDALCTCNNNISTAMNRDLMISSQPWTTG